MRAAGGAVARRRDAGQAAGPVEGYAEPPFGPLADAFRAGFAAGEETGVALAVFHNGRKVVDLWGGLRDRASGAPWEEDTLVPVFSTGKGLAALLCLNAVSRGRLRLDEPVARFWPAFGSAGKETMTLRHILDHKAGLPLFGAVIGRQEIADPQTLAGLLERAPLRWRPGRRWGYHVMTFGALVGEVLRRTDPEGRDVGRLFAAEIARPNDLAISFGAPDTLPDERLARVDGPLPSSLLDALLTAPFAFERKAFNPLSLLARAAREVRDLDVNDRGWLRLAMPSTNGVATARSIAQLYAGLAAGGGAFGLSKAMERELRAAPDEPPAGRRDAVMGVAGAWRLGFIRPTRDFAFSPSPEAFGMPGLGGSFGFCDPARGLAYAYTPNRLGVLPFDDRRDRRLRHALYASLGERASAGAGDD